MDTKPINIGAAHICTAPQMRLVDAAAMETARIPGIVLMENAALACVNELHSRFDFKNTSFAVFCGKGNNGGDGLAVARHLSNKGAEVYVYLTSGTEFAGDAGKNYDIVRALGIPVIEIENPSLLKNFIKSADCVVDAMLGTGLKGAARGMTAESIRAINEYSKFVLAVDIPSGVDSDSGEVLSDAVKADVTVTFAAYKRGMFLYPGANFCGKLVLYDISVPDYIMEVKGGRCYATDFEGIKRVFPKRADNSHKGDYGKIMVIGGSVGMSGAVAMSAKAALRCGAGLITAAVPASINNIIQNKIDEVMTLPLPEEGGRISRNTAERLAKRANLCDAVLLGPGLGRSEGVTGFVAAFLQHLTVPAVIDADGIYAVSKNLPALEKCNSEIIITPHSQELGYLTGKTAEEIEKSRFHISAEFAAKNGLTLILKGHHTIITAPDGDVNVNMTGNAGMAGAGSGDVLAGMCTAFLARGMNAYDAAVSAVYLHGAAGDYAAKKRGMDAMCAGDIISSIHHILPVEN